MKHSISKYKVGAKWEGRNDIGQIGTIWLAERNSMFEVWRWSVVYDDGSGCKSDWEKSYKSCRYWIPLYNQKPENKGKRIVFKRVE